MTGSTSVTFLSYTIGYKQYPLTKAQISLHEDGSTGNNKFTVWNNNREVIYDQSFGQKKNMNGMSGLNINVTLVGFTQFKIDIGPSSYSVTTNLVSTNSLLDINIIEIWASGLTVDKLDIDCH